MIAVDSNTGLTLILADSTSPTSRRNTFCWLHDIPFGEIFSVTNALLYTDLNWKRLLVPGIHQ